MQLLTVFQESKTDPTVSFINRPLQTAYRRNGVHELVLGPKLSIGDLGLTQIPNEFYVYIKPPRQRGSLGGAAHPAPPTRNLKGPEHPMAPARNLESPGHLGNRPRGRLDQPRAGSGRKARKPGAGASGDASWAGVARPRPGHAGSGGAGPASVPLCRQEHAA